MTLDANPARAAAGESKGSAPSTANRGLEALLKVAQRISSELDTDALVQTIVQVADELFDTTGASVAAIDSDGLATHLGSNHRGLIARGIGRGFQYQMSGAGGIWDELRKGNGIIIKNVRSDEPFAQAYRATMGAEIEGLYKDVRSWMAVPMMYHDRVTGWLVVSHTTPGRYGPEELEIANAIASQAAVGLENARLFEESQRRAREARALLQVAQAVASTLELDPLLDVILQEIAAVLPHERFAIMLREGDSLLIRAVRTAGGDPADSLGRQIGIRIPLAETPTLWKLLRTGAPQIIDEVRGDSPLAATYRREVGPFIGNAIQEFQSWMGLPLMRKDECVGVITVASAAPNRYTARDSEVGAAIAAQVSLAVENARLFGETRAHALELEVLSRADAELFRSLNLDEVLQRFADVGVDILGADKSLVTLGDPNRDVLTVRASRNLDDESIRMFNAVFPPPSASPTGGRGNPGVYRADGDAPDNLHEVMKHAGIVTAMDLPIQDEAGVPIGGYGVGYTRPHEFTEDEKRLLKSLADRAGVAIRNAALFERAQKKTREVEAMVRADAELFGTLDLDQVLKALADVAVDVLGADKSVVMIHEGEIDQIRASRNYDALNLTAFNQILRGMPHVEPAPTQAKSHIYSPSTETPEFIRNLFEREDVLSHLTVPIRDAKRMLGVFGVSFISAHEFGEEEQRLYSALADRAAVAIQNAELYGRAQHAASLEERQRLARELHDSVSQALYGIALGTRTARLRLGDDPHNAAEPIDYVMALSQAGLAEMRALIFELRPESLEQEGVVAAIEKQIASTRARYSLDVTADLGEEPECSQDVKEALYRIAQEALHNIVKHAHATRVEVRLAADDGDLVLTVADDGRGFDSTASFPGHVGLHSMPERAAKLGGRVSIDSAAGAGTRITARIPR
jgi:signal transduction histidine kinase